MRFRPSKTSTTFFLTLIFTLNLKNRVAFADHNGGTNCAACTLVISLIDQYAQRLDVSGSEAFTQFCKLQGTVIDIACEAAQKAFAEDFDLDQITELRDVYSPDEMCLGAGFCVIDEGREACNLFPWKSGSTKMKKDQVHQIQLDLGYLETFSEQRSLYSVLCDQNDETRYFCGLYVNTFGRMFKSDSVSSISALKIPDSLQGVGEHTPQHDRDNDGFGPNPTLRGWHWRGYDCDDSVLGGANTYPGLNPELNSANNIWDKSKDSNCNGIQGTDSDSGIPYEELYCKNNKPRGIMTLGDSATAHFHIPQNILIPETWDDATFKDLIEFGENEADWPHLSWGTGFENISPNYDVDFTSSENVPDTNSLYQRMREWNRCAHNDYQNNGVNGGDSVNMQKENGIMYSATRNNQTDQPLVVPLAVIGNDICNGHDDTLERMTTPEMFYSSTKNTLEYLDDMLPAGSSVLISGLVDGRVLWGIMNNLIHPIGRLNNDVRYRDLYGYLECLEVSPCMGWLTGNSTLRDLSSERARELTMAAKQIVNDYPVWRNFKTYYYDFDVLKIAQKWVLAGEGVLADMIDPVDGFHPSQTGMALQAEYMWDEIMMPNVVEMLGEKNPYNDQIIEKFGDDQVHGGPGAGPLN